MFTLFKKEVSTFLSSLLGYTIIAIVLLFSGLFLWVFPLEFNIMDSGFASLDGLFLLAPFIFLFLIPAITMRSFADERKAGTIELLMTKPLSDFQIILAKYLSGFVLVLFSLIPTLVYVFSIIALSDSTAASLDPGETIGSYLGLLLLGASFVAIGIFTSSVTDNQIVSFLLGLFVAGFFYIGFELIHNLSLFGSFDLFIKNLGINSHYLSMGRGVIDSRDLIYFLSLIAFFLLLTKISIQRRKW